MSNNFRDTLHHYGRSTLFLIGIILFSAGSLFDIFLSFSAFSLLSLVHLAFPLTGFWLIFAASKKPALPEKTLPALTLFKVSVIIELVGICLTALLFLVLAFMLVKAEVAGGAMVMLLIFCALGAYIFFYYGSILKIINRIRRGIVSGIFDPICELKLFTILVYINVGISVLGAFITAASSGVIFRVLNEMLSMIEKHGMMPYISGMFSNSTSISAFFTILSKAGIVICIIVLNQFNESFNTTSATSQNQFLSPAASSQNCSFCGGVLEAGDVFCENCGRQIGVTAAPTIASTPAPPPIFPQQQPAYNQPPRSIPSAQGRMPLIFLIDTSAAAKPYLNQLSAALNRFKDEVCRNSQTRGMLDAAVIEFNDSFQVLQGLTSIGIMKPLRLIASGNAGYSAPIQESLRMAADYLNYQTNVYKPWIIIIAGGRPMDDITAAAQAVQNMQQADKLRFMALGFQGYDLGALKRLTDVVFRQNGDDFTAFFDWVSNSISAIAKTGPGEKPVLPTLQGNVYRDK